MSIWYLVRRLVFVVVLLFGLSAITFTLSHLIPADPARLMAGSRADQETIEMLRAQYRLDDSIPDQYLTYVKKMLTLDFGTSFGTRRPVSDDLGQYLPATLELATYAFLVALLVGVPLGVVAAVRKDTWIDSVARLIAISGVAVPVFWVAILAQYVFFGELGWLPDGQRLPLGVDPPPAVTRFYTIDALIAGQWNVYWLALQHLVLPVMVLAFSSLSIITRMIRGGMLDALAQDYVRSARAKGLKDRNVVLNHAARNALLPAVSAIGLQTGLLLSGAFLVEIVFSWPGLGRYEFDAIGRTDYNAIMGSTLVIAVIFVVINFIVDLLSSILDPRIST